ncbi:MAG: hypothetical protein ACO3NK_09640 [Prochlorotrichaceae cyanobacterium]|jgi:hypothetical protein
MVAAAQSSYPNPSPRRHRSSRSKSAGRSATLAQRSIRVAAPQVVEPAKVASLSQALQLPLWLRLILAVQQSSSLLVLILGTLTLGSYASVVYSQHRWGQAYETLESLRQEEYQVTAINESLKENLVNSAAQNTALKWPEPNDMVFLEPTEPRPPLEVKPTTTIPASSFPLGY